MPQVSIITALHNKEPYVAETIRSVLAQTVPDWELIVVENGSNDNGPEVVRQYADSRIRLVVSPKCGPGAARNYGLNLAAYDWVLFLDADDLIEPDHLSALLQVAGKHPQANVIAGGWKEFPNDSPTELHTHRPGTFGFCHERLLARSAALAPWILHAAMIKRSILIPPNHWPEDLDNYPDEDTAFWFQVLLDGSVAWADSSGARYRRFSENCRSASGTCHARVQGYSRIVEHNLAEAKRRGVDLSPNCYGHISMMFEVGYRTAMQTRNKAAADFAMDNAVFWLNKTPVDSWNISLRKWLGIPTVHRLKTVLQFHNRRNFSI